MKKKSVKSVAKPLKLFLSHAPDDRTWAETMERHLQPLFQEGLLTLVRNSDFQAGDSYKREIEREIEFSDIFVPLLSDSYTASDSIIANEISKAIRLHEVGICTVMPIMVKQCSLLNTPFQQIDILPKDGRSIAEHGGNIWHDIVSALRTLSLRIQTLRRNRRLKRSAVSDAGKRAIFGLKTRDKAARRTSPKKAKSEAVPNPQKPEELARIRLNEWKASSKDFKGEQNVYAKFGATTRPLRLDNLGLTNLPTDIRGLSDIEVLDVSNNRIRNLPNWIGELVSLKILIISNNILESIPPQIGRLALLAIIQLSNNRLKSLPNALRDIDLKEIALDGNAGLQLPQSIHTRPPGEIIRYYFESLDRESRPLLELKLLIVGRGGAGKTTLIKRLAGETPSKHETETHSIAIRELMLDFPKGKVRARAWDFGGQEILHATHQFFLTDRSLYLLVLEPRSGLAQRDAEYWLKLIEVQGSGSPVIVALNWSDERHWQVDEIKLRRKFPFITEFVATGAYHNTGIDRLQQVIMKVVQHEMREVWLPFPRRWREIKDSVAGMHDNFLTYDQYCNLCIACGEREPQAQTDLAGILHALGLALYFGKDPRLHDTRVLNPTWVTGGVYAIIRSMLVAKKNGQLALSDMPTVLSEAQDKGVIDVTDYPANTHHFILELMRAFQLCYTSEEEKGRPLRYLVPELLPEFEPEMSEDWERAPVRLRYRYEVLPPGLLPKFIVRTHALSEGAPHWRHGVVLRHAEAIALIREETDRPELQLFFLGSELDVRRTLVSIVRRELETLHDELKIAAFEEVELTGPGDKWISVKALREIERPQAPTLWLPVQPQGTAKINVPLELDKLSPKAARDIDRDPTSLPEPVRLFVSYAHEDERQLKRLDAMLDVLEQQHGITSWRDKRLIAGNEWDSEIRRRLEEMDIFVFIASQTSLVRPYIKDPEIRRARERLERAEIEFVVVKLEACASDEDAFFGKLQRLAPKYKSIAEAPLRSSAWEQVRKDLLPVVGRIRDRKMVGCSREALCKPSSG